MATQAPERHEFQAEVRQVLDIVINSLYTDREIFLRELVSNAADSLEKLRHIQLTEKEVFDDKLPLEINITTDDTAGRITIQDFGIGLTREELVQNLGTIAHSGSKAFVNAMKAAKEAGENPADASLQIIGQFGVGFYSAFMVASKVEVFTHSWRPDAEHLVWRSDGSGAYEIEPSHGERRGAKLVITLKEDYKEFAKADRVKEILRRYSSFVPFPINVNGDKLSTVQAIWTRSKSEVSEEEYTEFYKFQANAFDEPLFTLHFSADAPLAIQALLFTPKQNTERFGFGRMEPGVALYCKKVLIDPKPEGLLPDWLRFLRGVVDSADLPLNISRESMQDSALVQKLGKVIVGRYLKSLDEQAKSDPEKYKTFWKEFGSFLKEGVATDFAQRERLSKLLRYESSLEEKGKLISLADYVGRMKDGQNEIYYLYAPNRDAIENGPYLEPFKARGLEVLFLYEPVDEFVMSHLIEFEGKKLVSADTADLTLEDVSKDATGDALPKDRIEALCKWLKELLGQRAREVSASKRLVESPVVALNADKMMTPSMRRLMKLMREREGAGESEGESIQPVNLELNPRHPLIRKLDELRDSNEELAKDVAEQIFDNALIAAGFLDNPHSMVRRINKLLERVG